MATSPWMELPDGMRDAYAAVDWDATPLGPTGSWSPALCNATNLMLHTRFPVTLLWGPEFVLVYNEAYISLIADKHPAALGATAETVFPEAWDIIGPIMHGVLAGEGATWIQDALVPLNRRGYLEETYFTYSYSPVTGPDGRVEGVIDIAAETTQQVIAARRLLTLSRLRDALAKAERVADVPALAVPVVRADERDFAAADIRELPAASEPGPGAGPRRLVVPLVSVAPDAPRLVLDVTLNAQIEPDADYHEFVGLIGTSIAQALDRVRLRESGRRLSETLQRSLLTPPAQTTGVQVAVRYEPAAEQAQVGGDWYDSFVLPDGTLTLAIGDVTGHDRNAAAAMAQARNLLRGVTCTLERSPAAILQGMDSAMHTLALDVYASAVLAQIAPAGDGEQVLRWSNAGHPPPVLIDDTGRARLLEVEPNLLLGFSTGVERHDHSVPLPPGTTVVFYTDGLVERRGTSLTMLLDGLVERLDGTVGLSAEAVCDQLTATLVGDQEVDDDVALLVIRAER